MRRMVSFSHGWLELLLTLAVVIAFLVGLGVRSAEGARGGAEWAIVPSPNVGSASELHDVTASGSAAWAVGWSGSESDLQALIERWDGSAWVVATLPALSGESALYGVDSLPSGEVWAVGRLGRHTLVLHWQGSAWEVVPSPNVAKVPNRLLGVSVVTSTDVWAVGKAGPGVVIEHWNGHTWRLVDHPQLYTPAVLTSVLAVPGGPVWVVGAQSHPGWWNMNAISMRWTGTRWIRLPVPLPRTEWPFADQESRLERMTLAGNTVWSAGWYTPDPGSGGLRGIIRSWADGAWRRVAVPEPPNTEASMLFGIGGTSPNWIWAVGMDNDRTYAVLRNAGAWQVVATPNPFPPVESGNFLCAVDSSSGVDWAVGYAEARPGPAQTLIMRYQT